MDKYSLRVAGLIFLAAVAGLTLFVSSASASSGCKSNQQTSTTRDGNTVTTTFSWCWGNGNVTSVTPTGGNTTWTNQGDFGYYETDEWTYGYVGTPNWDMDKLINYAWLDYPGVFYDDCLRNELHLHGDGTQSSNPGSWRNAYSDDFHPCQDYD